MVGFWSVGNDSVAGDYILETAAVSNVVVIPPDETGSFIPRIRKAQSRDLKVVLMIRDSMFQTIGGILYPDHQTRFANVWNGLSAYHASIVGFYLIDEPYLNNAGAAALQRPSLSEPELKKNLVDATNAIKTIAPGRIVMFSETPVHVSRGDFAALIPSNVDYVAVNCYLSYPDGVGYPEPGRDVESCTEVRAATVVQTLSAALQPHQKLMVTADGYFLNMSPGYPVSHDQTLRSRIIFWEHLLAPYFASGKIGALTPFIYQNFGSREFGISSFPYSLTEMNRYMLSVKNGIPHPVSNIIGGAVATTSGTYLHNTASQAFDGDVATGWNAGGFAPQWISVDLGSLKTLYETRMRVGQAPPGQTTHKLYISQTGNANDWQIVQTFSGVTDTGMTLTYKAQEPLANVRYIKIETTESPSWVAWPEIEVWGL